MNFSSSKSCFSLISITVMAVLFFSGIASPLADEPVDLKIMEKEAVGKYLADSIGITLYSYARDDKYASSCIEGCAANWPPFYADISAVGDGLDLNDFAVITRQDSRKQVTFKGMPLYYFVKDKFPGDIFGRGIGDVWSLVSP